MEEILELIIESLLPLTSDNVYFIDSINYSAGCFGNIIIQLSSSSRVNIEIIKDRNTISCSISTGTGLFAVKEYLEDVFLEMYGTVLEMPSEDLDIIEYIQKISDVILKNKEMMVELKSLCKFRKISKRIWKKTKRYYNI